MPKALHVYISCIVKNAINVIAHIKSMNNIDIGSYKIWMKIMMPYTAPDDNPTDEDQEKNICNSPSHSPIIERLRRRKIEVGC